MAGITPPFINPWFLAQNPMGYANSTSQSLAQRLQAPPPGWTPELEKLFRAWMSKRAAESDVSGDANHPLHAYDYRRLFHSGQGLSLDPSDSRLHGSSQFKAAQHPNRFVMDGDRMIDSISGRPVTAIELLQELYKQDGYR